MSATTAAAATGTGSVCPKEWPYVSIVMPLRNEAAFIEPCVRTLLANDYPADRIEILAVDGLSTDATPDIVNRLAASDPRIRLLSNPKRIRATALNVGIREARGEIIILVDGHITVAPDFIRESVEALRTHPDAWIAGGPIKTVSSSLVGRAIAGAMSSPVGVGNAWFRIGHHEGYVDTVAFGAYWRWVFDKVGLFDERSVKTEDDEFHFRVLQVGGKIYMTPRVRTDYISRATLGKLARQYFSYGYWRSYTIVLHRRPAALRQIVPLCFLLSWLILLTLAAVYRPARGVLDDYALLYSLVLLLGAIDVGWRVGPAEGLISLAAFPVLHFAYGIGGLFGAIRFGIMQAPPTKMTCESPIR